MYNPKRYESSAGTTAQDIIRAYPLATAISIVDGAPFVSYLPCTITKAEPELVLSAHCAKANPHWKYFERSDLLLIFRGPQGYISPRFANNRSRTVPTWNYVAVHCTGTAAIVEGDAADDILRALVAQMEPQGGWKLEEMGEATWARLRAGIVVFEVQVEKTEAKFKLSQQGSDGDKTALLRYLKESATEQNRELANLMERAE